MLIGEVERDFGSIDVLHYNVASMRKASILEQDPETFMHSKLSHAGDAELRNLYRELLALRRTLPREAQATWDEPVLTVRHAHGFAWACGESSRPDDSV